MKFIKEDSRPWYKQLVSGLFLTGKVIAICSIALILGFIIYFGWGFFKPAAIFILSCWAFAGSVFALCTLYAWSKTDKNSQTTEKKMSQTLNYYKTHPIIVIYHGNCADGFGAAYAVRNLLGDDGVEYYAGVYQQSPPDVKGHHVIMVDFCYKPEVVQDMRKDALSILILDHHKSAMESFAGYEFGNGYWSLQNWTGGAINFNRFIQALYQDDCENCPYGTYAYFDMERSGAMIAWEFFNDEPAPRLFHHIQDRDLWQFKLTGTREIQAAVFSNPYDFGVWDILVESEVGELMQDGEAIERKHFKDINELLKVCQREMDIAGYTVPVASLPYTMSSDAGHKMSKNKPFAACYWDTKDVRIFSLRSNDDGIDVSEVALIYGGGGHRNAAGFSVPRDHDLAIA